MDDGAEPAPPVGYAITAGVAALHNYVNCWLDEKGGKVFCLVDAPDADSAVACHREAHGLTADEIHEVIQG